MEINKFISDLTLQLVANMREYLKLEKNPKQSIFKANILRQRIDMINALFKVIKDNLIEIKNKKRQINHISKLIKNRENSLKKCFQIEQAISQAKEELLRGTVFNNLCELNTPVIETKINFKSLISFSSRISSNIQSPENYFNGDMLPLCYYLPFPDDSVIKRSLLYLKSDDKHKLKPPVYKPDSWSVISGTRLELSYPEKNMKGVYFKYTLDNDKIPTFFNGERYDPNNKLIIDRNMTLKVCSCKDGYLDSEIISLKYQAIEGDLPSDETSFINQGIEYVLNKGPSRPHVDFNTNGDVIKRLTISPVGDDESESVLTSNPASAHQIQFSLHRRESQHRLDDNHGMEEDF